MRAMQGNPWKGVVPYTINDPHPFNGRDEDIENFFEVIETNDISTLYGRSGIGKTSLINAGLFPLLKEQGYYPISIRLGNECPEDESFAHSIVAKLQGFAQCQNNMIWPLPVESESEVDYLWCFFAYHRFFIDGQEVVPVIVLDQFEEVLRNSKEKSSLLIRQLSATLHDGTLADGSDYTIGFRFIISIREDDLFLLEDCLDDNQIGVLKRGRYRLRPVDAQKAKEEIIFADRQYFDATTDEQDEIARLITDCATQDKQISTLLLSLLCSMAYEKCKPNKITIDNVKQIISDNPLLNFYKEAIKNTPDEVIEWIETNAIDGDYRKGIFVDSIPNGYKKDIARLSSKENKHRIFTKSSRTNSIELLHDKIAISVTEYRIERRKQKRLLLYRKWLYGIVLSLLSLLMIVLVLTWQMKKMTTPVILSTPTDTIQPIPQPYEAKNGKLYLTDKTVVVEDALFSINNVRFLEIGQMDYPHVHRDDESIYRNSECFSRNHLFSECDTLVLSWPMYSIWDMLRMTPNLSVLVLPCSNYADQRRGFGTDQYHVIPTLKNVIITDTVNLKWHMGTLFAKWVSGECWYPLVSNREIVVYQDTFFSDACVLNSIARRQIIYDIANPPNINAIDSTTEIILTCSDHRDITKNDIPEEVKQKVVQIDFPYAQKVQASFINCTGLQKARLPQVKSIEYQCFAYCPSLKEIYAPRATTVGVGAFLNTTSLESINLPDATEIKALAFENSGLTSFNIPRVEHIGSSAFSLCDIDSVILPNAQRVDDNAFLNCKRLVYVDAPSLLKINSKVFGGCNVLETVIVPNVECIESYAFEKCVCMQQINLPSLSYLSARSFSQCASLRAIYAPNLKQLEFPAFDTCINLKKVVLPELDTVRVIDSLYYHPQLSTTKECKVLVFDSDSNKFKEAKKVPPFIKQGTIKKVPVPCNEYAPKIKYYDGYYLRGNHLIITDTVVHSLYIPNNVAFISGYIPGVTEIEKIKLPFSHKEGLFSVFNGVCWHHIFGDQRIVENRKRIPAIWWIATPPACTEIYWPINDFKTCYICLKGMTITRPVSLYVPYGHSKLFHRCSTINNIREIKELSFFETIFETIIYNVSKTDILDSILPILIMLISLIVNRFKLKRNGLLLDILMGVIVWVAVVVVLFFDWRTLYSGLLASVLYIIYLYIIKKRKNEKTDRETII